MSKTQTTKPADAKPTGQVSSREQEREAARQATGSQGYASMQAQNATQGYASQQAAYNSPQPDYYQLSYLKRPDEGALWERHTEYFPTHDDSTTRALALSTGGAVCVRTMPRYWVG